jgi:cephalosporin hydroxylase
MITTIDEESREVIVRHEGKESRYPLESAEGFAAAARAWVRASWDVKYIYSFSWLGRPIIQLPDDMLRIQEVVYAVKPDVLIETGVAHGGSLVFYASLFKAMDKGRVIGIDVEIRPHNRKAIEAHELKPLITLVEGSSIEQSTFEQVKSLVKPGERVLVVLDSNHLKDHVLAELRLYGQLVSKDSYIVAMDGVMEIVAGGPRTKPDWPWNNPRQAALAFAQENKDFVIEEPKWPFNEGIAKDRVSYWPDAFLKRVR